ncbi:MoaD/ThiS family protein [Neomoorella mulderi]|uniref:ThiS family protein n=1 Tax=Moorella mulderi DSM 14980 TaxID=1122241 RepID=A0A151AV22_9FIRM|nr:MoaD/ThiS family protein [Moorella mulderi]KYH31488.1 ThiS family protein [Moorella mulderi DSM 14980]
MKIYIELHVPYTDYTGRKIFNLAAPVPLKEVLKELGVEQHIALVNGKYQPHEYLLQDDDLVVVLPFMSGG